MIAHLAGGPGARGTAREDAEDHAPDEHPEDAPVGGDLVIGVTAGGRTPYVAAALREARSIGAATALLSGDPAAPSPRWPTCTSPWTPAPRWSPAPPG